eukprot:gene5772-11055_t
MANGQGIGIDTMDEEIMCAYTGKCIRKCPCLMNRRKCSPEFSERVSEMSVQIDVSTVSEKSPLWCVCGECTEMPLEKERVCCKNKEYGHQYPLFEHHVLFKPTLELAIRNNADHLHYPLTEATMPVGEPENVIRGITEKSKRKKTFRWTPSMIDYLISSLVNYRATMEFKCSTPKTGKRKATTPATPMLVDKKEDIWKRSCQPPKEML